PHPAPPAVPPRPAGYPPAPAPPVPVPAPGGAPSATYRATERTRIGRAPDNDIVLDDLQVSRYHAELRTTPQGLRLVDLGTRNGSFVNGQRVGQAELRPGDMVSFGRHRLVFDGTVLAEYVDTGRVSLRAAQLTVTVKGGKKLLHEVSFDLDACSLLAVVGPSGAGKSTLLGALTGYRPANQGTVVYQGRDLYAEYDELRQRVGLVPQDDILHPTLTVRRALRYAAALRFGPDVTPAERAQRIDDVIDQLGLAAHAEQRIDTLSGGQRKRTSVALELLTEPSLLFLDEPTSGLDPALDRDVMVSLRDLADRGRTVVVVTHSPLHLNVCDRVLVLGRGGKVAYFGPPDRLLGYFGASEYADVFKWVYDDPDTWAARYAAHVTPRPAAPATTESAPSAAPPKQGWWRQLAILTRRMAAVTLADRMYALLLLGLPLGLAALLHVIPGDNGFSPPDNPLDRSPEAAQLLVVLIIGAVFFGLAGGIRELVRERAIYRRERAVGLSPGAYLGSKLLIFSVVNLVQAALFVTVGLIGRPQAREAVVLGWPLLELIVVVWLTALVSTVLGLLVSGYVSTGEQTMPILVGLVMAQLVLCGGLFEVVGRGGVEQLSWLAPSRWGYAAAASTVELRELQLEPSPDQLWDHTVGQWAWAMAVLWLQAALLTGAARWALRRHEPGR
ncbi:MAG: ATP-binding cassette domain-containing protein, partial [Micromonosporaceae bacterium]